MSNLSLSPQFHQQKLFPDHEAPYNYDRGQSEANADEMMNQVASDAAKGPVVHIKPHQALSMVEDGAYKTAHQSGVSNGGGGGGNPGARYMEMRDVAESSFGWNKPVYGTLGRSSSGTSHQYGKIRLGLDPKHIANTTATGDDSLGMYGHSDSTSLSELMGSTQPKLSPHPKFGRYVETQTNTVDGTLPISDFTRAEAPATNSGMKEEWGAGELRDMSGDRLKAIHSEHNTTNRAANALEGAGMKVTRRSETRQPKLPMPSEYGYGSPRVSGALVESNQDFRKRRTQERMSSLKDAGRLK